MKTNKQLPIGGLIDEAGSSRNFKTGDWKSFRPIVEETKCSSCMFCVAFCPENCIHVKDGKRSDIDLEYCKGCGICANVCPTKAIKMQEEAKFLD
ncbi:MAG TPA: 4Fe-4S binding protein [Candidatus Nanoarchaeia archaeon]|nr:4Fe-4S binding protein [Candidatus Nanoarchaeia archaeon]